MDQLMRWFKSLMRRRRIVRLQRREIKRDLRDERDADHLERVREGIKDNNWQGGL